MSYSLGYVFVFCLLLLFVDQLENRYTNEMWKQNAFIEGNIIQILKNITILNQNFICVKSSKKEISLLGAPVDI